MTETNFKKHASLRGVSEANDAANQLTEFRRGQSASVTTLSGFAALNRLGCRAGLTLLTVKSCDFSVRIWNRLSRLAMTQCAFTMAEILLSLTIIGVVAAITLPSLMANINERTWNTQRKALYARMSQAIAMMPQLNGYGTLTEDESGSVTADTAAETFLTEGLSKVLKINNICDSEHLADCGVVTSYTNLAGSARVWPKKLSELNGMFVGYSASFAYTNYFYSQANTKAAAFETQNGETITLFYNPYCHEIGGLESWSPSQSGMCANFIYDLNGNKGPNTVGKDIGFITALYSVDSVVVVAPMPFVMNDASTSEYSIAKSMCSAINPESRVPNKDELLALFYNSSFLGTFTQDDHFSGDKYKAGNTTLYVGVRFHSGEIGRSSSDGKVRCIIR